MVSSILPLSVNNASVIKRGKRVLNSINAQFSGNEICMVIGPNGAGKTTFLRLLHGLERPSAGTLNWAIDAQEAASYQSFVLQTPVMMRRNVLENVAFALQLRGVARKSAYDQALEWLERTNLTHKRDLPARALSGGERQKLALARALIIKPQVLFLDEPCANLDGRSIREIEALITTVHELGTHIIMSTHDLGQARRLASQVLFFYAGTIHERGSAKSFFANPSTPQARAFLNGDIVE